MFISALRKKFCLFKQKKSYKQKYNFLAVLPKKCVKKLVFIHIFTHTESGLQAKIQELLKEDRLPINTDVLLQYTVDQTFEKYEI